MNLIVERSDVLPLVTLGITFRAGRADEPTGRAGLARATAQMVRRGAGGALNVEHRLDRIGAELSEHVGLGATTFSCEVLARSLEPAAALLTELLEAPCTDEEELGRVVRQGKAALVQGRDDDSMLCSRALRRHLFAGHPHGDRVLGSLEGLDAIVAADVAAFGARHYTAANAVVHVSGAISVADADRVAARLVDALPAGAAIPYPAPPPTPPNGRRLVIVNKQQRQQTQLGIGTLGADVRDDDYFALLAANAVFGGTFTSRLMREIRSERGWSYGASSSLTVGRVREAFTMWTAPAVEDAADCLALELELLEAWHRDGISDQELSQCQSFLVGSHAFEIDTPAKRLQQKLERFLLELPEDFHDRYLERLAAVTRDDANAAIRRHIHPDDLWIACVADADDMQSELSEACGALAECVVESVDVP